MQRFSATPCKNSPKASCRHCTREITEGTPRYWDNHKDKFGPTCLQCYSICPNEMADADKGENMNRAAGADMTVTNQKLDVIIGLLQHLVQPQNATF